MTIRAELDYRVNAWENAQLIGRLLADEWNEMRESVLAGHDVRQRLELSGVDAFLLRMATNSFHVTALDFAKTMSGAGRGKIEVREHPHCPAALLALFVEDRTGFNELVRKGDLPGIVKRRDFKLIRWP